jgi:16S rRNA (uracil1498-N3)-methyltransferase
MNTHEFAIYLENLSEIVTKNKIDESLVFSDQALFQRLIKVLRLRPQETFIIFDEKINILCAVDEKTFVQKKVCAKILQVNRNQQLQPEIIFCPSILKKAAFEEVIYSAAEIGATIVQPIIPAKAHVKWWSDKEYARCLNIMIAACEQSKNFVLPKFYAPLQLENFLKTLGSDSNTKKVIFELGGEPLFNLLNELKQEKLEKVILSFGPEGGFTDQEVEEFKSNGFKVYSLTPTVLRAPQAVVVGLGSIRSVG